MSAIELDKKVQELRELRSFEAEIRSAISVIEDDLKAEMLAKGTDVLNGQTCMVTWKTVITSRFDSGAFKLSHADLFQKFSKATTSRRLVIV